MADYYPLISRAVTGLERNTGENRRSLYERARNALLEQLRNVTPALSETDITRERLALEEAIRKVESDVARRMREEAPRPLDRPLPRMREPFRPDPARAPTPPPEAAPSPPTDQSPPPPADGSPPDESAPPPPPPPLGTRPPFGRVIGRPEITAADLRRMPRRPLLPERKPPPPTPEETRPRPPEPADAALEAAPPQPAAPEAPPPEIAAPEPAPYEPGAPPPLPKEPSAEPPSPRYAGLPGIAARRRPDERPAAPVDLDAGRPVEPQDEAPRYRDLAGTRSLESPVMDGVRPPPAQARPPRRPPPPEEKVAKIGGRGLLNSSLITIVIAVLVIGSVAGALFWQRNAIRAGFVSIMSLTRGSTTQPQRDTTPAARSKIPDRIGQAGQAPSDQPKAQQPASAQRVVLYEEDPSDKDGKRYEGTVVWSLENIAAGPGQPMDKAIRGDIVIPERNMTVTFTIRRNTDKDLPASHTVSIMFTLPADFSHGGVQEIRGLLMKQAESTRGVALAGLSVKVTTGFFLIGLSASEGDVQRNIQMLKERGWFDIAIVYNDNRRAILAVEKGPQGDQIFSDAFAAWGQ